MKNCYETLHSNKLDNVKEMYKFLKAHNLPRLKEERENLNRLLVMKSNQ